MKPVGLGLTSFGLNSVVQENAAQACPIILGSGKMAKILPNQDCVLGPSGRGFVSLFFDKTTFEGRALCEMHIVCLSETYHTSEIKTAQRGLRTG